MATKFVRVKDRDTKHEHTVTEEFAKAYGLDVIDKPAVDDNNRPLPGKPHIELAKADEAADDQTGGSTGSDPTPPAPTDTAKASTTKSGGTAR